VQRVLIDEVAPKGGSAVGRSMADAPEIDGVVHVKRPPRSKDELRVGEFVDVRIESSDEHDLAGTLVA
jgi:ribosomal protein S12 methylthiotransferase